MRNRSLKKHRDITRFKRNFTSFNKNLAITITGAVGTMTCAYIFAGIALISLPAALKTGDPIIIVAWVAQTFLQLTLLSVIVLGQDIQGERTERRDVETHDAVMSELAAVQGLVSDVHALLALEKAQVKEETG